MFTPYPTKLSTPNRKTRKGMRRNVFMANKTAARLRRKAAKALLLERQETS